MKQLLKWNFDLPVHVAWGEAQRVCVLEATDVGEGRDDGVLALALDDLVDVQQVVVDGVHLRLLLRATEDALVGR